MEEKLRHSAQEWQATFNAISDAICLADKEGRILQCNRMMLDLLGMPYDEIKGRKCCGLLYGTPEPPEECPFVRMQNTHHRETLIMQMDDRWLDIIGDPLFDDAGNFLGAVAIIADITEHRMVEEKLRDLNEFLNFYRTAVDSLEDYKIAVVDESYRYRIASSHYAALYDLSEAEMVGKIVAELMGEDVFEGIIKPNLQRAS